MSFSGEIKEELCREQAPNADAERAELFSILYYSGLLSDEKEQGILIRTDQVLLAKKVVVLVKNVLGQRAELTISTADGKHKNRKYQIGIPVSEVPDSSDANLEQRFAGQSAAGLEQEVQAYVRDWQEDGHFPDVDSCRAWIRGVFLSRGSMSDPEKSYHLEWIFRHEEDAKGLMRMINVFEIGARLTTRKNRFVVYVKDSTDIVDMLNIMGAHRSLMQMENVRIMKEMRNSVNRQFNCDTANIKKIVRAAGRQLEDIRYISQRLGLEKLPPTLRQMAEVRLEYPDVSLQELGELLDPPVGKSGVNHRLRKLSAIAANLRDDQEGNRP